MDSDSAARTGPVATPPRLAAGRRRRAARGQGERLRGEILKAAQALLASAGTADGVSIRAIADAVGVTPPSIYLHFADKEELIRAVCEAQFACLDALVDQAVAGIEDPLVRLRTMGETYVAFGTDHPEQYRVLLMARRRFTRAEVERGEISGMAGFVKLIGAVEACIEAGSMAERDPFVVATGLWAVVHGITSLRISVPGFPLVGDRDLLDHVLDTYARGLAP